VRGGFSFDAPPRLERWASVGTLSKLFFRIAAFIQRVVRVGATLAASYLARFKDANLLARTDRHADRIWNFLDKYRRKGLNTARAEGVAQIGDRILAAGSSQ
jgi:hypothetical protein